MVPDQGRLPFSSTVSNGHMTKANNFLSLDDLGSEFSRISLDIPAARPGISLTGTMRYSQESSMEPRISLITLGVADLERATRFYAECLNLPRIQPATTLTTYSPLVHTNSHTQLATDPPTYPPLVHASSPMPGHPLCGNKACTIPSPPTVEDGGTCTATRRIMHTACSAPGRPNECLSCSFTTGTSVT